MSAAHGVVQEALAVRMLDKSLELVQQQMDALVDPATAAVASDAAMQVVDAAAGHVDVTA